MIQRLFAIVVTAIATTTTLDALVANETLPSVNLEPYIRDAILYPPSAKYESAALSKVMPGVCYSPFHNKEYPLNGGSAWGLDRAMDEDFSIMKNYVSVVRTYYSSFYGYPVAPWAAKHGIKLHLGVFMTNEAWYANQVNDAVNAVKQYPDTITAILVGNENITPVGPYTPQDVANRVKEIRARVLAETGRQIPVGTVQRAAEWLDGSRRNAMSALAADCDLVGVNIYPFFDANYDANMPLVILNAIWGWLSDWYPPNKLRLTEIGFPTAGGAPSWAPRNIPSLSAAQNFYNAFVNWNPAQGGGEAFWFMFFDRSPNDNTMLVELEKYFGFFTYDKKSKGADFPARLSALNVAVPPTPTPAPPPATSAPVVTTTAPAVTSAPITKSPWTAAPANVCRVRKIYFS